jgi:hypothetical protein
MLKRLFLVPAFVLFVAPLVAAPGVRLQFEIYKNGTLVGTPMLTVQEGGKASLSLPNFVDGSLTPTRIAQDKVAIVFELTAAGKTIRPRIGLLKEEQGVLSWKPASDSLELRVTASSK